FSSLAFDASGMPAVSYYDTYPADLRFVQFDGANWHVQTLAARGAQGLYSKLSFDDSGLANILYYNRRFDMMMKVSASMSAWETTVLHNGGGRFIAAAPGDQILTY